MLASIIEECERYGVVLSENVHFKEANESVQKTVRHLTEGECSQAEWHARNAISNLSEIECKAETPCLEVKRDADNFLSELAQYPLCEEKLSDSVGRLNEFLEQSNCEEARSKLDQLESSLQNLVAAGSCESDEYTFDYCRSEFENGNSAAWQICEKVASSDPNYHDALKIFIVSAGESGVNISTPEWQEKLKNAINTSTSVDVSITDMNARAYTTMVIAYGWDTTTLDVRTSRDYYKTARGLAPAVQAVPYWWKAKLIMVRCAFRVWRENPTETRFRQQARIEAHDFINYMQEKSILDRVPGSQRYVDEARKYLDMIERHGRSG